MTVAAPLVLTIHDVSFFAHPEWFSFREGVRRRLLTAWSARRARTVITDTDFSKSEIERFIGVNATSASFRSGIDRHAIDRDGRSGRSRPIVLYVGSLFERRRVDRLIRGVRSASPIACPDAAARDRRRESHATRTIDLDSIAPVAGTRDRITIRSYVDEATLASLYRRASVFAFLSEYEGFGLTPLEALADGVPPVVLDTAVARETCGAAARYVAPSATNDDIAAAIADLLTNVDARQRRAAPRRRRADRYDWTRAAAATLSVLEEAAGAR